MNRLITRMATTSGNIELLMMIQRATELPTAQNSITMYAVLRPCLIVRVPRR